MSDKRAVQKKITMGAIKMIQNHYKKKRANSSNNFKGRRGGRSGSF